MKSPQATDSKVFSFSLSEVIMDLLKLLTYKEKIGAISIFDSHVEMLVLEFKEKESELSVGAFSSVAIPPGTIIGGVLKNKDVFVSSIKELLSKNKASKNKASSFIVSIPGNSIYYHNFSFPHNLSDEQIDEAMKINLKFSLPIPQEAIYVDWESIDSREAVKREINLCVMPRGLSDQYLSALSEAGAVAVALEFHSLSISRVVSLPEKEPALIVVLSDGNLELAVVESGAVRFLQSFNIKTILGLGEFNSEADAATDKIWRAVNFYDAEKGQKGYLNKIYLAGDYEKINDYKDAIPKKIEGLSADFSTMLPVFAGISLAQDSNLSQITFGAALRGLMPREEDVIISLMPIGTEKAYEQKRMISFVGIASDLVSVLSVFFAVLFIGSWILMTILLGNIEKSLEGQASLPEGLLEIKDKATIFNGTVAQIDALSQKSPQWSKFTEKLGSFLSYGVTINRIDVSFDGVTIGGVALTRDALLQFKTILEKTDLFSEVRIPFNYLEQKDNISFSLTLKFKNPDFLFDASL